MIHKAALAIVIIGASAAAASATVSLYTDGDAWKSAVDNNFTTIDFTGGENFTFINDDYADQGVIFSATAHYWNTTAFVNDDWGMRAVGGAWLTFDTPQQWIAADFPGNLAFDLYYQGDLFYSSTVLGVGGLGNFGGLISSKPFDMVYLFVPDPPYFNIIAIDDLHFGALVPAPAGAALGLLALAGFAGRRRRTA